MSFFLTNKKRRTLGFCVATLALMYNLNASSQWTVSSIGVPTIATGLPTYVGGSATPGIAYPRGIAIMVSNVYVADTGNNRIVKGNLSGNFTALAGNGTAGSHDDTGINATFQAPQGIAVGSDGNVYVTDTANELIRQITPGGVVTTFAGTDGTAGSANGILATSTFNAPVGIAIKGPDLYVTDTGMTDDVRKISAGTVSTIPTLLGLDSPSGIAFKAQEMYVTDSNNGRIQKLDLNTNAVTTFAAGFGFPNGIAYDPVSNVLYVVDTANHTISQVDQSGTVTVIAGTTGTSGATDGSGATAQFNQPNGIAIDDQGNLYVTDTQNHVIRKLVKITGASTTITDDPTRGRSGGTRGASAANAASNATENEGEDTEEANFRFKLTTNSIKLSMRSTNNRISGMNTNNAYASAYQDMERSLDAVQGLRQDGGKTFWISGLYDQGKLSAMLGNPAADEHHWGIMAGCHYKDAKTKQIFGVAIDVGIGDTIAQTDRDLKTDIKSAQLTFYYNKMFANFWKFNIHANYMRAWDRHQRPITTNAGKLLAIANGISHEFSLSGEFNYKYQIDGRKDHYWKPFFGFHYAYDLQDSYQENNVGIYNRRYEKSSGDQLGLIIGAKANLSYKINDTKSFVVLPKITYTYYLKMLRLKQWSYNISSGARSRASSGTPGRNLLSASLGFGINDSDSQTSWKVAYTGNVQEQRKSHEVMLDFGVRF